MVTIRCHFHLNFGHFFQATVRRTSFYCLVYERNTYNPNRAQLVSGKKKKKKNPVIKIEPVDELF